MSLTSKNNEKIGAVNRGTPCESGLCNFCRTDCQGRCETWLSSLLGRRTLVPRDYGNATIGTENTTHVGVSYNALRIRGRVFGGAGLDPEKARTGDAAYCDADLTTAVGSNAKYPCDYPFLIGALVRLRGMDGGKFYILVAFLLSMVADSGAYFVGRACGKHKLAPIVSPKKTVEGAVGGVVCNIVFLCLYTLLLNKCFSFTQVNYFYAAIYGVLGAAASIVGDLTLSVVKRQVGIKDYGNLIPGHGGILDRFDSTMLVAPLTELLILLIPFAVK